MMKSLTVGAFRIAIAAQGKSDNRIAFEKSWRLLHNSSLFSSMMAFGAGARTESAIRRELLRLYCSLAPNLYGAAKSSIPDELLSMLRSDMPIMLVDFHQRYPGVTKCLCDHGIAHYRVVASESDMRSKLTAMGLDVSLIHFVERSISSLAILRKAAQKRNIICSSIDFKSAGIQRFASPAMLELAGRLSITVVFLKTLIDENGMIILCHSPASFVMDANVSLQAGIDFFNSVEGDQKNLDIMRFSERL
ncbi:hypothetical protein [Rhizobium sp. PAMB 3182]